MSMPPDIPSVKDNRRRSKWKLIFWTCLPAVVIFFILAMLLLRYDHQLSAEIEQMNTEREAIASAMESEGLPVSEGAWATLYPPPEDFSNAAPIYEEAFASIAPLPPSDTFAVPFAGKLEPAAPGTGYSGESLNAMRAHLTANQRALELADSAASLPRAQFETYGFREDKTAARDVAQAIFALLSLRLELMGIDGAEENLAGATRSLHSAAQMLDESPDLVDVLIAWKMRRDFAVLLSRLYARVRPGPATLDANEQLAWRIPPEDLYARSVAHSAGRIEFPEQAGMFLLLEDRRLMFPFPEYFKGKWADRILAEFWLLDIVYRRDVLGLVDGTAKEVASSFDTAKSKYERDAPKGIATFNVPLSLEPVWAARAYDRMLEAMSAIERYRQENDALPETLDTVVPSFLPGIPADPYDGAPIRYQQRGDGYLLYCVGVNLADDGGMSYSKRATQQEKGDVVLAVHGLAVASGSE